ncbi:MULTISPECIES: pseudaminic acid synthase [unclassified Azospirillum]|uniref:pseudaminic acid synthase n=1 Tax=unclassified Azospirillum TaxID=2630922 RepID=UPI000B6C3F51|nr:MULTISPECIES: pseudaminic acid synthase [unclassified Azospirillum]SNS78569.1 N-acetylneuraminate synthase [Azospirillum sp. RU38E]SNS95811.1 N-acetylneuraminate synthase [Azospirillum sp. RU37A]
MTAFPARFAPGQKPFLIAELSGNHNGDIDRARRMIDAAKAAGADAVKLQTYTADTITLDVDRPEFRLEGGLWAGRTLYELYQEAHTPWDWHPALFAHAAEIGIPIFSSPFDPTAIDLLESLGAPAYKIASFELIDLPLIEKAARTGKPLIMSTGMASLGEVAEAVAAARVAGNDNICLLHCVSGYPTPVEDCDLRTIPHLAQAFDVAAGLSDHTMGVAVPVAAVALGAVVIEKHFTLARADGGPDAAFSLEPAEFRAMADACAAAHAALGSISYALKPSEAGGRSFRRSLYITADIAAGEVLTGANVRSIRPGLGLPPKHLPDVLGRVAARNLTRGEPLDWTMLGPKG